MKKIYTLFFCGLVMAGTLLTSCGTEKISMSGNYRNLAIAQQSPDASQLSPLPQAPLAQPDLEAPVFSANLDKAPGMISKTRSPKTAKTEIRSSTVNQNALVSHEKHTQVKQPNHRLRKAGGLSAKESQSGDRNWIIALLLVLFIGGFGVHRFYLGYTTIGIIQLVMTLVGAVLSLFIIGIPILLALVIWVFVDMIRIAVGDLKPKDGEYENLWFQDLDTSSKPKGEARL
jgi:TM2 domain-containing membrane protein YozV